MSKDIDKRTMDFYERIFHENLMRMKYDVDASVPEDEQVSVEKFNHYVRKTSVNEAMAFAEGLMDVSVRLLDKDFDEDFRFDNELKSIDVSSIGVIRGGIFENVSRTDDFKEEEHKCKGDGSCGKCNGEHGEERTCKCKNKENNTYCLRVILTSGEVLLASCVSIKQYKDVVGFMIPFIPLPYDCDIQAFLFVDICLIMSKRSMPVYNIPCLDYAMKRYYGGMLELYNRISERHDVQDLHKSSASDNIKIVSDWKNKKDRYSFFI